MGQPSQETQAEQIQTQVAQQNQQLEQQLIQFGEGQIATGNQLQQPLITQQQELASGNRSAALTAAGPQLGNIAQAGLSAQANILNTQPAGAPRDLALEMIPQQTYSQSAGLLNSLVNQAPQTLAQIGASRFSLGTTETGQSIGAGGTANAAATGVAQESAASKSSTLGFLGALAGAGGSALSGSNLFGLFGNNSSSSAPFQPTTGPNPPTVSSTEDFG